MRGSRIFVTRRIPDAGLQRLSEAGADVTVWPGPDEAGPTHAELVEGARNAVVILSLLTETIDRSVLAANPRLLGVSNCAVGYDNIAMEAATSKGIPVGNTPDVLTESTADMTWALLLAAARLVVPGDAYMRSGRFRLWGPQLLLGVDVSPGGDGRRKTLGIVGFGRIGRAVARRAAGFDMRILVHDPSHRQRVQDHPDASWAELDELLANADFVSLHVPLTAGTHHLIGAPQLNRMKPMAILVNTSRGAVVDESALVEALRDGRLGGAGLDVYEHEPAMADGLDRLDNVILMPHLGSASHATRGRMAVMAADNAIAMLRGEPAPCCLNPEVYASPAYRARLASHDERPEDDVA